MKLVQRSACGLLGEPNLYHLKNQVMLCLIFIQFSLSPSYFYIAIEPPYFVVPTSGRQMSVKWRPPSKYSGLLTAYIVAAEIDGVTFASAKVENPGPNDLTATISNLKPFTSYRFSLTVCNTAGCTKSPTTTRNSTSAEAPEGMAPPSVAERTPHSLHLTWKEPSLLNGDLTGYQLFRDGIRIYAGQHLEFNVTNLRVASTNRYFVEACTVAGCARSESTLLTTRSLPPPAPVPSPLLTPISPTEVRVAWLPVDSSNGIIQSYNIYLSLRPREPLATSILAVANESSPTAIMVDNLTPGTTYFFRLNACTNGGCTVSEASSVITFEAPPDGIQPLNIMSPDPSRIDVYWEPPSQPNGALTQYVLFHNGRQVFSGLESRHYEVTGLPPWSRNQFQLKVCNAEGCNTGNVTIAFSMENTPEGTVTLDTPSVIDSRSVRLRYWGPQQPNGNISYRIMATGMFMDEIGSSNFVVRNDSREVLRTPIWQFPAVISNLIPFANYTFIINATNSKGFMTSNIQSIQLPKGAPLGFSNPIVEAISSRSVKISWKTAAWSNGDPVMGSDSAVYMLQWRNTTSPDNIRNAFSFPVTGTLYVLKDLRPFTKYEVRVIASNSVAESTYSQWIEVITPEDCPEGQQAPEIKQISSFHAELQWNPPRFSNGKIIAYRIYGGPGGKEPIANITVTDKTSLNVTNLIPNTNYEFVIESCTAVCCNTSSVSGSSRTPPAPATGISPPKVEADSPTSVFIQWQSPQHPNGYLKYYLVEREQSFVNGTEFKTIVTNVTAGQDTMGFIDKKLMPFTEYKYRVIVQNDAGRSSSAPSIAKTKPTRPLGVLPPQIIKSIDPNSIFVSWPPPVRSNGILEKFILRIIGPAIMTVPVRVPKRANPRSGESVDKEQSKQELFETIVSDLKPYTDYNITISACSDGGGCADSPTVYFKTLPTSPEGQMPPLVITTSQSSIFVQWMPPQLPNGRIKTYTLDRVKTRQPLENDQGMMLLPEQWETIYIGNSTYYEDQNLPLFTFYRYRVTAISDFGRATSMPSLENCTFGEDPLTAPELNTSKVTHDSINVTWTNLGFDVLRGVVAKYVVALQYETISSYLSPEQTKKAHLELKEVSGNLHSTEFTDLIPSTAYTVMVSSLILFHLVA